MKNKLNYQMLKQILIYSFGYIVLVIIAQILLSGAFEGSNDNVKNGYFDFSFLFAKKAGFLMLSYMDAIRLCSVIFLLIPYVFLLARVIRQMVSLPLERMMEQMSQMRENPISERLSVPAQCEVLALENSFNELLDRLEQVDIQKRALEEKNTLLISGMAHDLKTPITTLRGYTQALSDHMIESEEKKQEYLDAINRKAVQMDELITVLFDYVRLGSAHYSLNLERCDVVELIREEIAIYYTEFEEHNMEFEFDLPEEPVWIMADKRQLARVFSNLYSNALKYGKPKTCVHTAIETEGQDGEGIKVVIADTSDPISPELEPHMFDPFVMGDYARKTGGGNGLGLCIAFRIMELHGGTIRLSNHPSGDFTKSFILKFPEKRNPR